MTVLENNIVEENHIFLDFNAKIYLQKFSIRKYLRNQGNIELMIEKTAGNIPLLNKYVEMENRKRIPFIGREYSESNLYTLQSLDVTHEKPVLVTKLNSLEERDIVPLEIQKIIEYLQKKRRSISLESMKEIKFRTRSVSKDV